MSKESLAVKYRPKSWDALIGQPHIRKILENQIATDNIKHAYLFCGGAGTGKTTSARIVANLINEGKGRPIELDCASRNGVDDVRDIIEESRHKPFDCKYKIFIMDECMTGDTEILTDRGYIRFDSLQETDKVAQYNDDGTIDFVVPKRIIRKEYKGNLVCWQPRRGHTIKMTPNHVQPLHYIGSDTIKENYIKDTIFAASNEIIVSGKGKSNNSFLSAMGRIAIATQADAHLQHQLDDYNIWLIQLKKERKINRILELFEKADIEYTEVGSSQKDCRRFSYKLPKCITKNLRDYFGSVSVGYSFARDFIDEVVQWDGYIDPDGKYVQYMSTNKDNTDFVSAIAVQGGYSCKQKESVDNRKESYKNIHDVRMYDLQYRSCQHIAKTKREEYFDGMVYCVEVPSHKIVVRADGFSFITGNCHMLSQGANNALLKVLEEPPEWVIFIFCTTDPQKVIGTIHSRVQKLTFKKVSVDDLVTNLKRILAGEGITTYTDEALTYIARLAKGGVRDSVTTLEKCYDYNHDLNIENVIEATAGGITEGMLLNFLDLVCSKNAKEALLALNDIYMSGIDMSLFDKLFKEFIQDCIMYLVVGDGNITHLSENVINILNTGKYDRAYLGSMLESYNSKKGNLFSDETKIMIEGWIISKCI